MNILLKFECRHKNSRRRSHRYKVVRLIRDLGFRKWD